MKNGVKALDADLEADYSELVQGESNAMIYHSLKYRALLERVLEGAQPHYLCSFNEGVLEGALPMFVREGPCGPIVNSLPYFGSHGGIIKRPNANSQSLQNLRRATSALMAELDATSCTVIEPLFDSSPLDYEFMEPAVTDTRLSHVTWLPSAETRREANDLLMQKLHSKTRNLLRKGLKLGFDIVTESSLRALEILWQSHTANMSSRGGNAKKRVFFEAVADCFDAEVDYNVYIARDGENVAAALLLLYFKNTVEYFIPVIDPRYRSQQPLSVLIHTAMLDAVLQRKSRIWNWGGTWKTQKSLQHFKAKWGAEESEYNYHVSIRHPQILQNYADEELKVHYPNFYVRPYGNQGIKG